MKKMLILAVAAVVALAGCSKNTLDPSAKKQINFSAVAGMTTKAPLTGTTYGTDAPDFGMFAYALTSGTWAANSSALTAYMNNVKIVYNSTDKIWEPDGTSYYWPLSGTLTFIGYSPYMSTGVSYAPATKALTFTDFVQPADSASQKDLMYAETAADKTDNEGVYSAGGGSEKGVNIVFHHALSQVCFAIKKANALTDYTVTVKSLSFNAYSKGTLVVTADTPDWGTVNAENLTYNVKGTDQAATTSYVDYGGRHMIIPQTLTAGQQKFSITYSLAKGGIDLGQKTVSVDLRTADLTAWANNTKYTYNIEIDLNKIYFNPSMVDWVNGTAQNINVH